jgi:1-acyl-sn-glycerol-3-phosphate acyltransferase
MNRILKILFFGFIIRPLVFVILGLNIRCREKLPKKGPAIIAANHNSHLDTMVLMSLYPLLEIHKVRPVAAADYFLSGKFRSWFSQKIIGIIPLDRSGNKDLENLFSGCHQSLDNGDILIIFPEGSRGNPEQIGKIKKGIFYLTKDRNDTEVIPVVMHGLGKVLPRGEALFVPFNCDVIIGDKIEPCADSKEFTETILLSFNELLKHCITSSSKGF